jgi:hypothetical protein
VPTRNPRPHRIHLAAVNRTALALSQFVDSLGTLTSDRVRGDSPGLDFSNQLGNRSTRLVFHRRSVPDWEESRRFEISIC